MSSVHVLTAALNHTKKKNRKLDFYPDLPHKMSPVNILLMISFSMHKRKANFILFSLLFCLIGLILQG